MALKTGSATPEESSSPKKARWSVLDHFTHISDDSEACRVKNAIFLLKYLNSNTQKENDEELKYALDRLVRGLGASRKSARIGFYSTLVALLNTLSVPAERVLESIQKQLHAGGANSKSESGDIYTGQVFACGALLRSKLFLQATTEEQGKILEQLLHAGKKRSYLALAVSMFLVDLLNSIDEDQFGSLVWPTLKSEVLKSWPEQTLDSLHLLLLVQSKFPVYLKGSAVKKAMGTRAVLCEENVKYLGDILLNVAAFSSLRHPGYAQISKEIAASDIAITFVDYLDSQLTKPNRNKLLAVSIMLQNILPNLQDHSQIPQLLTSNFVHQTLQYFRNHFNNNHDKEFHAGMLKLFDTLASSLKNEGVEDKVKVAVLKNLLFYPGSFMIENIIKSRILQPIVQSLAAEGVKKLSKLYKEVVVAKKEKIVGENATEPWLNAERVYAAQLLVKLIGHPSVQSEIEWKVDHFKLLLNLSIIKHPKYSNVGNELAGELRDVFFRALDQKYSRLEDMLNLLINLTNHLKPYVAENSEDTLRVTVSEEESSTLRQMYETTAGFQSNNEDKCMLVFQILFLHMGLQIYKDKELAVTSLKELSLCYQRVQSGKKRKSKGDDADPEWIEVVVDLFLNLLSHHSHLLRNIIGSVFPHLCNYLTPSSIHQILSVLDPKNENNPLSPPDESDSEEDNDGEESGQSESEEEESENEYEGNETVNDKLRMAVRQALGNDGYQTDEGSVDLDEMSESEGRQLDEALAKAFREYKPNRGKNKKQTKDQETLTHFRVRALDLLEIYIESEPSMLSCLEIMLPLLQVLEFSIRDEHQVPLQARIKSCLKKLTNLKKFDDTKGVTETVLEDILNSLLGKGTKSTLIIQDMSTEISECCVFIIKCSQVICSSESVEKKTKRKLQNKMIEVLSNVIKVFFDQRDCLIPYSLFKCIFQLNWEGTLKLAPLVFEFVFKATTRPFRRSQALELLKLFYLNRRLQISADAFRAQLGEHEVRFCNELMAVLEEFCRSPQSVTIRERFVFHVFNLLKAMASHPFKNEDIGWKALGERVREYRSNVKLSRDAKVAYNQLCAKLHVPNVVKMKDRVVKLSNEGEQEDERGGSTQAESRKQSKRKKILESNKLKKEARELRIKHASEGFPEFCFSKVNLKENESHVNGDDTEEPDSTSSKKGKQKRLNGTQNLQLDDSLEHANFDKKLKNRNRISTQGNLESHRGLKTKTSSNNDFEQTPCKKKKLVG